VSEGQIADAGEALGDFEAPSSVGNAFRVALPNFEGPLDLLLHLIREHRLDILDIPIALITEKYLESLALMKEINLDVAGEFLVMASTLAHIKSRLLLPKQELAPELEAQEQGDPRAELVRRLLEYQKYKDAAESLARHSILDRDVFPRRVSLQQVPIPEDEVGFMEISIYKLIEVLDQVLKNAAPEVQHEVVLDRISLSEAIHRITDKLRADGSTSFLTLFESKGRQQIVITFLALLEMCKLRLIRIHQEDNGTDILITAQGNWTASADELEVDESEYK
jgi:segregation and condensation protein A